MSDYISTNCHCKIVLLYDFFKLLIIAPLFAKTIQSVISKVTQLESMDFNIVINIIRINDIQSEHSSR